MKRRVERISLKSPSPGTTRFLTVHRYGTPGDLPKVYMQAGIHADELPGVMAIHHLIPMLDEAAEAGRIRGEIVLVAYANPIGMGQRIWGTTLGRNAFSGSGNFNRDWPHLTEAVAANLSDGLDQNVERACAQVRVAMREAAAALPRSTADEELVAILLGLAIDADTVLDIHCDRWSTKHLFADDATEDLAIGLASDLAIPATLMSDVRDHSFEGAAGVVWRALRRVMEGADHIPSVCFSATVELRGRSDVSDVLGQEDAEGLMRFLIRRGHVTGEIEERPPQNAPFRLDQVEVIPSPAAGMLSYRVTPGDSIEKGQVIADLINPEAENPLEGRTEIRAGTSGFLIALADMPQIGPGERVCMIAGREPITNGNAGPLNE